MPVLPDKNSFGKRPVADYIRPIIQQQVDQTGNIMVAGGQQLQKFGGDLQDSMDEFDYQKSKADFYFKNVPALDGFELDTDYSTMQQRYTEQATVFKNEALSGVRNPKIKAKLAAELDVDITQGVSKLDGLKKAKVKDYALAEYQEISKRNMDTYNSTNDAVAKEKIRAQQVKSASSLESIGVSKDYIVKDLQKWDEDATKTQGHIDALKDPDGVRNAVKIKLGITPPPPKDKTAKLPSFTPEVNTAIDTAAAKHNVPVEYMYVTADIESGGDPTKKNPNSSAAGLYQFLDSTAARMELTDKYDATASAEAAAKLYNESKTNLQSKIGREPTNAEVYLAHQQGDGGAALLLNNPNKPAIDILTTAYKKEYGKDAAKIARQALLNNGGKVDMTAAQFAERWTNEYARRAGGSVSNAARGTASTPVTGPYAYINSMNTDDALELYSKSEKAIKEAGSELAFNNVQKTADILTSVNTGQIDLKTLKSDSNLSETDKVIAQAVLLGDEASIDAILGMAKSGVIKEDIDGLDSYSLMERGNQVVDEFKLNREKDPTAAIQMAMQKLNSIKTTALFARAVNEKSKGGKGLTAEQFNKIMKSVRASSVEVYNQFKGGDVANIGGYNLIPGNMPLRDIHDRIGKLTSMPEKRAELTGYAFAIADSMNIDLYDSSKSPTETLTISDKVMSQLKVLRAKQLNINLPSDKPASAALTASGIEQLGSVPAGTKGDKKISVSYTIMEDAAGNKAKVFKDGTIEEIK